MSNIETHSGMIASESEMLSFVQYLNQLANNLNDKMNAAKTQVENMHKLGYRDETFIAFREKFIKEVQFITKMNEYLKENEKYYTHLAQVVKKHNDNIIR